MNRIAVSAARLAVAGMCLLAAFSVSGCLRDTIVTNTYDVPGPDGSIRQVVVVRLIDNTGAEKVEIFADGKRLQPGSQAYLKITEQIWVPESSFSCTGDKTGCTIDSIGDPDAGIRPKS